MLYICEILTSCIEIAERTNLQARLCTKLPREVMNNHNKIELVRQEYSEWWVLSMTNTSMIFRAYEWLQKFKNLLLTLYITFLSFTRGVLKFLNSKKYLSGLEVPRNVRKTTTKHLSITTYVRSDASVTLPDLPSHHGSTGSIHPTSCSRAMATYNQRSLVADNLEVWLRSGLGVSYGTDSCGSTSSQRTRK